MAAAAVVVDAAPPDDDDDDEAEMERPKQISRVAMKLVQNQLGGQCRSSKGEWNHWVSSCVLGVRLRPSFRIVEFELWAWAGTEKSEMARKSLKSYEIN